MAFIKGLNSYFPERKYYQEQIVEFGKKIFRNKKDFNRLQKVYENSGVKSRYLVNDINWYAKKHLWKESNNLFRKNAIDLLKNSIKKTLADGHIKASEIGAVVVVNTTGISTPSLDAELINLFDFKNDVIRLPLFGYGCAGGVLGLNRSAEIFKCIKKPVLVCNVEICSLTFQPHVFSKENVVSTALFGDGASSYLIDNHGTCKIGKTMDYTWKNTLELMGWRVEDDGLAVVFDKFIPNFIENNLFSIASSFSLKNNLGYILHPGGMKIIESYKKIFNNHKSIDISKEILAEFGNVSSVSVLLVLERIIKNKTTGDFIMSALGPGFSAGLTEIEIGN